MTNKVIRLFNVYTEDVEYVRTDTIAYVILHVDSDGCCLIGAKQIGSEDDDSRGYYVKLFARREDIEEDADVKLPRDFYVFVKSVEEAKEKAEEYISKYMRKHFTVVKS